MTKSTLCTLIGCVLMTGTAYARCQLNTIAVLPATMSGMKPMIPAKINGVEANFVIDSGAYYSAITPLSAKKFGLKTYATRSRGSVGVGGAFDDAVSTVASFGLASYTISDVEFLVGGSEIGGDANGVIGQNILQLSDAEYDLGGGVVKLMRPQDCEKSALAYWIKEGGTYSVIDIEPIKKGLNGKKILAAAYINGTRMLAQFDTGASNTVVRRSAAKRAGINIGDPDVIEAGVSGGFGRNPVKRWSAPISVFKIGDEEIRNTRLTIIDSLIEGSPVDMLIGADFFLSHHIYVANSQQKLYFSHNGGKVFDLTLQKVNEQIPVVAATTNMQRPNEVLVEPVDADSYSRRGAAFLARREFVSAIADLTRAVTLAPTEAKYFFQRANTYLANSQTAFGLADLDQVLKLKPTDVDALTLRADIRLFQRNKSGAMADLALADKAASKDANIRLSFAAAYEMADEPLLAIRQFDLWIETHPNDGRRGFALSGRCWARALLNMSLDQALSDCNDSVKATAKDATALVSRGLVWFRRGDYNKAIADYDAALAQSPKNAWGLYGRGLAKLRAGATADGNADIAAAVLVMPSLPENAKRYGIAH